MIKSIIFDMDGVIIDSESFQFEAFKRLFLELGVELSMKNYNWVGKTSKENVKNIMQRYGIKGDLNELVQKRRQIYHEIIKNKIAPTPGTIQLIEKLSKRYKLALASSSSLASISIILKGLGIENIFDVVVSGEQVSKGKPNPEIFELTVQKMDILPEECIVLEDSQPGVEAAFNAGIKCVAIPNKYTKDSDFSKATKVVANLIELISFNFENL
jgi:HAD superfamily hydrolase (TIGR01509 family)